MQILGRQLGELDCLSKSEEQRAVSVLQSAIAINLIKDRYCKYSPLPVHAVPDGKL